MLKQLILLGLSSFMLLTSISGHTHCQVPCGIYDDHARIIKLQEDAATIEKAVLEIEALAGKKDAQSYNQSVRWVLNKEEHAQNIIESISNYFLTQRLKPTQKTYQKRLTDHHAVILAAMKTKQTVSPEAVSNLKKTIEQLLPYYPEHKHAEKK